MNTTEPAKYSVAIPISRELLEDWQPLSFLFEPDTRTDAERTADRIARIRGLQYGHATPRRDADEAETRRLTHAKDAA